MNKMTDSHITDGGTGVTNFKTYYNYTNRLEVFLMAIECYNERKKLFGDNGDILKIGDSFGPLKRHAGYLALHNVGKLVDLGEFWLIFNTTNYVMDKWHKQRS